MYEFMISEVPVHYIVYIVIVLITIVVLVIKAAPSITKWFNSARLSVNKIEELTTNIGKNTSDISELTKKVTNDFNRINDLERAVKYQNRMLHSYVQESELILHTLLGILQGLQELGANGSTKTAETEIQDYLLAKSHSKFLHKNPYIDTDDEWPEELCP